MFLNNIFWKKKKEYLGLTFTRIENNEFVCLTSVNAMTGGKK